MTSRYKAAQVGVIDLETGAQIFPGSSGWSAYQTYLQAGGSVELAEATPSVAPDPASTLAWNAEARIARQLRRKLKGLSTEDQLEIIKKEIGL